MITSLVQALQKEGVKVGTIKHHGHGGRPDRVTDSDSERHFDAGAVVSGVEGDGVFQWNIKQDQWSLDDLLELYRPLGLDVVLVEGYKTAPYPKWVMIRKDHDEELLQKVSHIKGVVYSKKKPIKEDFLCFSERHKEAYIQHMIDQIKGELDV